MALSFAVVAVLVTVVGSSVFNGREFAKAMTAAGANMFFAGFLAFLGLALTLRWEDRYKKSALNAARFRFLRLQREPLLLAAR